MTAIDGKHRNRRAVIIGGSMSGLFAAAFLRQQGWETDVYERSTVELVGRGAGITTHPELLEALEKSGAGTRDLGVEVEKRIALDRAGRVISEKYLPQILTSWDRLQRLLRDTIDEAHYHLGHTFERVDQDGSGVVVHFAGGRTERADILVGGDGIRSSVRAQMAPETQPIYAGYYIWRAAPDEAALKPETRASIFPYFIFFVADRQHVFGYPIAGLNDDLRVGHRRYNVGWYRAGDANELREMCADEHGHQHEYSVPPPLIRKDLIARMRKDAERNLPPQVVECLTSTQPFFTPIYDFTAPQFTFGRVALVGDAASSARPHMGFGMAKAGGDAQALAEALGRHDDIDEGLAAYNRMRQALSERIMLHGRKLGTQLGVNLRTGEDRAMSRLLQDHRAMMDHIGVPNFLERALTHAVAYPRFPVAVHVLLLRGDEVLLVRRSNTGYEDGKLSVVAGHVEPGEAVTHAAVREAYEEVGMTLSRDRLHVVGVIHRRSNDERVDFFLAYQLERDDEEPQNREPEKCSELMWAKLERLPADTIPYVRTGIENFMTGTWFQEFGWDKVVSDHVRP